jgi:hypothetical protein
MSRRPPRRGVGRGQRDREMYQRQIAGSPETPTAPSGDATFSLETRDSTAAPSTRAERISLRPIGEGTAPRRRRQQRRQPRSWTTIWAAVASIAAVLAVVCAGIWVVAGLQREIAVNAAGLKSADERHNTFAGRVADDIRRLEAFVEKRVNELLDRRREAEPGRPRR